jgi:hypothetical protein
MMLFAFGTETEPKKTKQISVANDRINLPICGWLHAPFVPSVPAYIPKNKKNKRNNKKKNRQVILLHSHPSFLFFSFSSCCIIILFFWLAGYYTFDVKGIDKTFLLAFRSSPPLTAGPILHGCNNKKKKEEERRRRAPFFSRYAPIANAIDLCCSPLLCVVPPSRYPNRQ